MDWKSASHEYILQVLVQPLGHYGLSLKICSVYGLEQKIEVGVNIQKQLGFWNGRLVTILFLCFRGEEGVFYASFA